ncbi:MAG: YgiT-type zinc finger protein [Phycisphaerales bacterium]|nr:YgiT-type zinc finger protein [Phycisphaerales bacterium]
MIELKTCPTCGSSRIRRVRRTVTRTSRGREFKVPNLVFYECPDCGEQVYSPEAMERIESCRPKRDDAAA